MVGDNALNFNKRRSGLFILGTGKKRRGIAHSHLERHFLAGSHLLINQQNGLTRVVFRLTTTFLVLMIAWL
ncbi:hypothetical protein CMV60_23940 [Serratia marcescens]|nr:hypothetical protein CMV60_23940 [Serratia marcescens]